MYRINISGTLFWLGLSIIAGLFFGVRAGLAVLASSFLLSWAVTLFD